MPPTTAAFSRESRIRTSAYLRSMLAEHPTSMSKIGAIAGVPASRVSEWISGDRLMNPDTAFELGENLRSHLGWQTSGAEFLWAGAYFGDLLQLLICLAAGTGVEEPEPYDGGELALILYCWLSQRMSQFESNAIANRLCQKYALSDPLSWRLAKRTIGDIDEDHFEPVDYPLRRAPNGGH